MKKYKKDVGLRARKVRERLGYESAEEFSEFLGIHRNTVYDLENGKSFLSADMAILFRDKLKVDPAELLSEKPVVINPTVEEAWEIVGKFIDEKRRHPEKATSPLLETAADLLGKVDDEDLLYAIIGFIRLASSDKTKLERLLDQAGTLKKSQSR